MIKNIWIQFLSVKKRRIKACVIGVLLMVMLLCGFSGTDLVLKAFNLEEYLKPDIITNVSYFTHDEFAEAVTTGVDWNDFNVRLTEHLESTDYKVEISPFEDSWLDRILGYLF